MPRFVLLEHDHPVLHWDLMLECGDALRTWRLDRVPTVAATIPAEPLSDHRIAYLDYEGPVSGDRGTVKRVDSGEFTQTASGSDAVDRAVVELQLAGIRLRGQATICSETGTLKWQPSSTDAST
jgi:hypothetical protein